MCVTVCSYTNPVTMSGFVNAGDNGCPLGSLIVNITTLLLLCSNGIEGILLVDDVDIVPHENLNSETIT